MTLHLRAWRRPFSTRPQFSSAAELHVAWLREWPPAVLVHARHRRVSPLGLPPVVCLILPLTRQHQPHHRNLRHSSRHRRHSHHCRRLHHCHRWSVCCRRTRLLFYRLRPNRCRRLCICCFRCHPSPLRSLPCYSQRMQTTSRRRSRLHDAPSARPWCWKC